VAEDGDAFGIDLAIGLEVIERAAQAPCPGGDRSPLVGCDLGAVGLPHREVAHTLFPTGLREPATRAVAIELDVTAVKRRDGVTAAQQQFQRPAMGVFAAFAEGVS
jgi:hypothetical protein